MSARPNGSVAVKARVSEGNLLTGAVNGVILYTLALGNLNAAGGAVEASVAVWALGRGVSLVTQGPVNVAEIDNCEPRMRETMKERLEGELRCAW